LLRGGSNGGGNGVGAKLSPPASPLLNARTHRPPSATVAAASASASAAAHQHRIHNVHSLDAWLAGIPSLAAASVNAFFGLIVAWVLVRYAFPGKRIVDALVDLPFALPTAVAGIALTAIYAKNGWLGQWLEPHGVKIAFTELGVFVALTFIGLPFVVRTLQPVLEELQPELEEAAASLGANRWQTITRVLLPELFPALLTGFALSFARALGEYGSVVFISGNMPLRTEIVPLLIITKLEQYDYRGATAIAVVMLTASFGLLLLINLILKWSRRHHRV
jgi:sulfate transport system permease protein